MGIYTKKYRILFNDIDNNLKITDIALMRYLVEISGEHSEDVGYGLSDQKNTNVVFLLTSWKLEIFKRAELLQEITINTWAESFSHSLSIRNFEIYLNNELIAKASTRWVLVNPSTHSILLLTGKIYNAYGPVDKKVFDKPTPKLVIPDDIHSCYEYTISRRDIDSNNHVNNLKYLELAYEVLPEVVYKNHNFNKISINYKSECKLSDRIICNYTQVNKDEHTIVIKNSDSDKIHSIINLKR